MSRAVAEPRSVSPAVRFALVVMLAVGLYDACVGLYMLTAAQPWMAHGPGTLWRSLDADFARLTPDARRLLMSLFRRMGAFSCFAGAVSSFVAINFRRDPRSLLRFMLLYLAAGLAFGLTDGAYFMGTPYYIVKQIIGVLWLVAGARLWWDQHRRATASAPEA